MPRPLSWGHGWTSSRHGRRCCARSAPSTGSPNTGRGAWQRSHARAAPWLFWCRHTRHTGGIDGGGRAIVCWTQSRRLVGGVGTWLRPGLTFRDGLVAIRRAVRVTTCVTPAARAAIRGMIAIAAPAWGVADLHAAVSRPLRHRTATNAVNNPTATGNRMSSIGATPRGRHPCIVCTAAIGARFTIARMARLPPTPTDRKQETCVRRASLRRDSHFCDWRRS